jgi:hypothetical protein
MRSRPSAATMKATIKKQLHAAIELYRSFRERTPKKLKTVQIDIPRVVAVIGHCESIDYTTTHGSETVLYRHDFVKGSRPLLCVSSDGKQLMLIGGRFKFTERGIVDRDIKGKEVENIAHGTELNSDH